MQPRWIMEEDLNIFENGRRPQFVSNGRQPQFCSRPHLKLIFGMRHYIDPTRWNVEDDLNIFENGRRPQFFWKWKMNSITFLNGRQPQFFLQEEDLNSCVNGRQTQFVINGRWAQFCSRQRRELIFGLQPYFNSTRIYMENDLNIFENGRWPQLFLKEDDLHFIENAKKMQKKHN